MSARGGFAVQQMGDGGHNWRRATYRGQLVVVDALFLPWTADHLLEHLTWVDAACPRPLPDFWRVPAFTNLPAALALLWGGHVALLRGQHHTTLAHITGGTIQSAWCLPCGVHISRPVAWTAAATACPTEAERWWQLCAAFGAAHFVEELP